MRRKIAIWSIVLISLLGCRAITANFPRDISTIELENGINIKLELNEDLMVFLDPKVKKKLTIDYGDRKLTYRTTDEQYTFGLLLLARNSDTLWRVSYDRCYEQAECSFSDENDQFQRQYLRSPIDSIQDTLLWIKYEDFAFSVKQYEKSNPSPMNPLLE
jgi:hypothetical protein